MPPVDCRNPAALELRRMQMVSEAEVGADHNRTMVIIMPSEFVHFAGGISKFLRGKLSAT